ncbi:MAG: recombination protein RecR [Magnetococcales bacterium]|nr:recombination protein RecR [Magnetococcales bacterium]
MADLPSLEQVVARLSRFPGVGRKSALRMAHHLLKNGPEDLTALIDALSRMRERVRRCERCFNWSEETWCAICANPHRESGQICVVEEPSDLQALERAGLFKGRYHVLGGRLSPIDGVGPEQLTLEPLARRLTEEGTRELILALNPTVEGEATAHYVAELARPLGVIVTRLAHGLPSGGELEYLDESTLYHALAGRREYGCRAASGP